VVIFGSPNTVPLAFLPGEAFQFDWSEDWAINYLIDLKHAVIMDVEATTAIREAEVGAAKTMLDRTAEQSDVRPPLSQRRERKKVEMLLAHLKRHPQARSIAPARAERSERRVPVGRHRPKSKETGEAHSAPGANLRHIRRENLSFASLTAAADTHRGRLKNGFSTKFVDSCRCRIGARGSRPVCLSSTTGNRTFSDENCALIEGVASNARRRRKTRQRSRPKSSRNFG
jgi:hypothetical protein